jgi:hypothetical protein
VVGDDVDDHAEVELVRAPLQAVEVVEGAEQRIHLAVVGDVVARVVLRREEEGGEPDRVDPELAERGESLGDAGEVADAVAVRVRERARVDLVDHGGAPPLGSGAVRVVAVGAGQDVVPGSRGGGCGGCRSHASSLGDRSSGIRRAPTPARRPGTWQEE